MTYYTSSDLVYLRKQVARILEEVGTLPSNDPYTEELLFQLQRLQYQIELLTK